MKRIFYFLLPALMFACSAGYAQITELYVTSSGNGSVLQGQTVLATPNTGFAFSAQLNPFNGISVAIQGPNYPNYPWYNLDLAAPQDVLLAPGVYSYATRYPFESPSEAGLQFYGNSMGDNTLHGSFTVDEVTYGPGNSIVSLAVDFLQYDEDQTSWWEQGSLRLNSTVPIPEPQPFYILTTLGFLGFAWRWRSRSSV